MNEVTRCGYVAIVGRPNVGKSTLLNAILNKKISITSPKPQTTRGQILGIKSEGNVQAIYIDTPGMHDSEKRAMNRYMNRLAAAVIGDADVILFMIEAMRWTEEDESVLRKFEHLKTPVVLVINKIDALDDYNSVLPFIQKIAEKYEFTDIVPLSARKVDNVKQLEELIETFLPESPFMYPTDQSTDKPLGFQIAEVIREKVIMCTEQEIPYSTMIEIENYEKDERLTKISAIIWVEREGQKPIVIGKGGSLLKLIGTKARKELEILLDTKVFLQLWVKVKDNWTEDEKAFRGLGLE